MEIVMLRKRWDEIINEAIDPAFKNKSKAVSLEKNILLVDCLNTVWAAEMRFKEEKIIEKIKEKTEIRVEKIKFIT
jgi:predicted nucleic acid-binding Zn ribbon protein